MLLTLTAICLLIGSILYTSGSTTLTADVRRNLNPQDIEQWEQELMNRRLWAQVWLLIGSFWMVLLVI